MTDAQTLELLQLIASGTVKWATHGSIRIRFYTGGFIRVGDHYEREPEVDYPAIRTLSERLYEREGWREANGGRVSLTPVGADLLAELVGVPKPKSVWNR